MLERDKEKKKSLSTPPPTFPSSFPCIYERIYMLMTLKLLSPAQISPELQMPLEIILVDHRNLQDTEKQAQVDTN